MVQSRVPATIDALVERLRAADLTVWDGPVVTGDYQQCVFVGYDGDPDGDWLSAESAQEWAGLGAKHRKETISVTCAIIVLIGEGDVKMARDAIYSILETVGLTLRDDPSLGQPPPFVAGLRPGNLYTEPSEVGMQARLVFSISVEIARV